MRQLKNKPLPIEGDIEQDINSMHPHFRDLAWCAIEAQKMCGQEVVIFCVELCDFWGDFANHLISKSHALKSNRSSLTGNDRFISGLGDTGLYVLAANAVPDFKKRIHDEPVEGTARLIVFYAQGVLSLCIEPSSTNKAS